MLLSATISDKMYFMNLGRLLSGLASAAVVAAAVLFAPATAQAHEGHMHGAATHASHADHHAPVKQVEKASTISTEAAYSHQEISAPVDDGRADQSTGNCVGNCCGNGLGCCGAVMFTTQQTLPDFAHASAVESLDFDYGSGIAPDALKRPPRTLA